MQPSTILELLTKEREYHASHPHQVNSRFMYGLGTSLASVVAAIYFSGTSTKAELTEFFKDVPIGLVLVLFFLGLVSVLIGLTEHTYLHTQQRKKIEAAINYILNNMPGFNYDAFWAEHQSHQLKYFSTHLQKKPTPLITLEPDTRGFWWFHDRKIELGALLMIVAYGILIYHALM